MSVNVLHANNMCNWAFGQLHPTVSSIFDHISKRIMFDSTFSYISLGRYASGSAGLLLTHLNFCHSEGWQGKLINGLGSVQSEGVMTETLAGVLSSTFLPLPDLLTTSHLCSPASLYAKCC